jgi:hypothetical protein
MSFAHSNRSGWRMIFRRGVRHELLVASLLARANRRCTSGSPFWFQISEFQVSAFSRWLHRADTSPKTVRASIGTASSRFHRSSARALAGLASFAPAPSRHVGIPTAANWRDRPQIGRTPRNTSRMSRGSARHEQAIARDASHGQDTAIRREASPVAEDEQ